jgi:hypothetical protein
MMISAPAKRAAPEAASVLTKAAIRAAGLLGLSNVALARVIGLSEASVSRMAAGTFTLQIGSKPAELATLLIRLYRSLDALVGNDETNRLIWMRSFNRAFGKAPREAIETVAGLSFAVLYLDGARAVT